MDFGDSPEEAEFRLRLRAWLAANNPGLPDVLDRRRRTGPAWRPGTGSLYDAGFFGMSWPTAIGGQGCRPSTK